MKVNPEEQQAFPMAQRDDMLRGMTMRQYYKAKALQGFIASDREDSYGMGRNDGNKHLAFVCGLIADAMLAEDAAHEAQP